RFPAEARRVSGVTDRQLIGAQDFLAMEVRYRHLRGRRKIQLVAFAAVKLLLEFRQLRRPLQRLGPHEKGPRNLGVTVLARLQIEQEIDQRPLQPRPRAGETRERRARDLRRPLKIEQPELL